MTRWSDRFLPSRAGHETVNEFRFNRLRKNHFGTPELLWSARLGERDPTPQDSRARLAGWARRGRARGPKFEVFETSNPELQTSDRVFLACLALHTPRPVVLADFFSIRLEGWAIDLSS
jgi:hypothetical protein